jgi:hypothetical protein
MDNEAADQEMLISGFFVFRVDVKGMLPSSQVFRGI